MEFCSVKRTVSRAARLGPVWRRAAASLEVPSAVNRSQTHRPGQWRARPLLRVSQAAPHF